MITKKILSLDEYLIRLQAAADDIAREKNAKKITVFHLYGGKFACSRVGDKMGLPILKEAQSRVNEQYELKAEE
jgi:hypothetical protein